MAAREESASDGVCGNSQNGENVMITIDAPWTDDQVASLNAYQESEKNHPFTGNRKPDGSETILIATPNGLVEEEGGPIVQTWAHSWAVNWEWQTPDAAIFM
jgi:hypothetical protein